MTCPLLRLSQPEQSEGEFAQVSFPVTQTSDAKSSVDDLGAGRGVVHGRAVPNSHCDLLRLSPSNKTGRFVLPERAGRIGGEKVSTSKHSKQTQKTQHRAVT